jgi:hypothetical protein
VSPAADRHDADGPLIRRNDDLNHRRPHRRRLSSRRSGER